MPCAERLDVKIRFPQNRVLAGGVFGEVGEADAEVEGFSELTWPEHLVFGEPNLLERSPNPIAGAGVVGACTS